MVSCLIKKRLCLKNSKKVEHDKKRPLSFGCTKSSEYKGKIRTEVTDFRLKLPFWCLIKGPTSCEKTYFVRNVLENCKYGLNLIPEPLYGFILHLYSELQKKNKKIKFVHGLPYSFEDKKKHIRAVIDF